jgi:Eco57I restriction-modification methylase
MTALPGIAGSLFPGRFLADGLQPGVARVIAEPGLGRERGLFDRWWRQVEATCGPATGLARVFDLAAMPLAGLLGFRARDARFDRTIVQVRLETRRGTPIALLVLPWAGRPVARWRDACAAARSEGADWCFVFAPPHLTLVDARGHAARRSLEFALPAALGRQSFGRFWLVCHAAAFDRGLDGRARHAGRDTWTTRLDRLALDASAFQDRVRRDLHRGVMEALAALSPALESRARDRNAAGPTGEALTIVYRILFLLFAESRELVPTEHPLYRGAYTVSALCRDAVREADGRGLWEGLSAITRLSRAGCRTDGLIVSPFNGRLFARASAPTLEARPRVARRAADERDAAMKTALVSLGTRRGAGGREEISYRDLGVEQLGAVYERVLDVEPGNRKASGTFYTPRSLADFVVRRTLAPLVAGASPEAILALRVVDPAMGSGAFLVSACRYLADAYERALVDEGRMGEADVDGDVRADIRRRIAERCLSGVDVNPTAVQLARLSLWLTSLARGKPLGFLDHQLRTGNSLIGAAPDDLWRPPRRTAARDLPLLDRAGIEDVMRRIVRPIGELAGRRDETVADVRAKEAAWSRLIGPSSPLAAWRTAAAIWCAHWFDPPRAGSDRAPSDVEIRAAIDATVGRASMLPTGDLERIANASASTATQHRFFHWPLEFAGDFYDPTGQPRGRPGFDAVIGNPPWEMLRRDGTGAVDAERERHRSALVRFIRECGHFPSCDRGHMNLYQPFVERALDLAKPGGRVGLVLPWGLAADDGATALRRRLLSHTAVDTVVGLDNASGLFPIHRGLRFMVIVASPGGATSEIRARLGVRTADELDELPGRDDDLDGTAYPVRLTPGLLRRVGGATCRIPDARGTARLAFLDRLASAAPPLGDERGWAVRFGRDLNATEDRRYFRKSGLPVIDGRHLAPFVVDTTSTPSHLDPADARRLLPDRRFERPRLGYRDVSGVGNRRALIAGVVPAGVLTTHTIFCLRSDLEIVRQHFLCGVFNSFVMNAVVRMLMGGHVTTSLVESLPVPVWRGTPGQRRVARLARHLARHAGAARAQAELEGEVARIYGLDADALALAIDTGPGVPPETRQSAIDACVRRAGTGATRV